MPLPQLCVAQAAIDIRLNGGIKRTITEAIALRADDDTVHLGIHRLR